MKPTRAPSSSVSPKRTPPPMSAPQKPMPCVPRVPAAAGQVAADRAARRVVVLHRDRQRPQRRPGARFEAAPLALRPRAEQPVFERPRGRREAGDEVARREVGAGGRGEDVEAAVAGSVPSRCSIPSCSACHQVPRTWVMPVPGGVVQRQRAKRVPETVRWPSRVKLFRWAPSNGSASGGRRAVGVRAELCAPGACRPRPASAPTCQPHWATAYLPARRLARATSSSSASASAIPERPYPGAPAPRPRHLSSSARRHPRG